MKKWWQKIVGGILTLSIGFSIVSAFLTGIGATETFAPISASADSEEDEFLKFSPLEETEENLYDDNFQYYPGASLKKPFDDKGYNESLEYQMSFVFGLKNARLEEFMDNINDHAVIVFTLCRDDGATARALYRVYVTAGVSGVIVGYSQVGCDIGIRRIELLGQFDGEPDKDYFLVEGTQNLSNGEILHYDRMRFGEEPLLFGAVPYWELPTLRFNVQVDSPFREYFVQTDYLYKNYLRTETRLGKSDRIHQTIKGSVRSSSRSIAETINNIYNAGMQDVEFAEPEGLAEWAENIYLSSNTKTIKIRHLKEIEGTPFAEKVEESVEVPVIQNKIHVEDVAAYFGVDTLTCQNSAVEKFVYNADTEVYEAQYNKNIWLTAKTVDGLAANYFLDINKSYEEFYSDFSEQEIFEKGLYEYCLNQIKVKYPALLTYEAGEVYGYFGYVVVPDTETLNALWADMFDVKTNIGGTCEHWQYRDYLTLSAYNTLLDEYKYSWIEKAWFNLVDGLTEFGRHAANHYVFYATADVKNVDINENGSLSKDDYDSVIQNTVQKEVKDTVDKIEDDAKKAEDALAVVFGCAVGLAVFAGIVLVWRKVGVTKNGKKASKKAKSKK